MGGGEEGGVEDAEGKDGWGAVEEEGGVRGEGGIFVQGLW